MYTLYRHKWALVQKKKEKALIYGAFLLLFSRLELTPHVNMLYISLIVIFSLNKIEMNMDMQKTLNDLLTGIKKKVQNKLHNYSCIHT